MVLRLVAFLGLILTGLSAFAQETEGKPKKKTFRPDIPGSIMVELGVNFKNGETPPDWKSGFWGSRTFNFYYQYPIRIFKTKFSINPGLGLSLERWKFTNYYTLAPKPIADGSFPLVLANDLISNTATINRSQLVNNYLEMPIELRFDTNPEDIARSFNISFGGRVGWLYDSFTKIDYRDAGENRSIKDKQVHGMNPFRYGVYTRLGLGGFSLFSYFNLSPMFQPNLGPQQTTMNSVTVGISVNGF